MLNLIPKSILTWDNILEVNAHVVVPIVSGLHVEEAEDVQPLVYDNGGH